MNENQLRETLTDLALSQANFARLLGVTPRAVTLWLSGERAVPSPVKSYLGLFQLLPPNLRQVELSRITPKGKTMREGMYGITFQGDKGAGLGALIFENGRIYGADSVSVKYDGEYIYNDGTNDADIRIKITFPPNVESVFGVTNPYEWSFDVTTKISASLNAGDIDVETSIGHHIKAHYVYLRPLPEAA